MRSTDDDDGLFDTARYQPLAALEYGTTGDETRHHESLTARLRREVPDRGAGSGREQPWRDDGMEAPPAGRLVADDEGAHEDTTAEEVALAYDDDGDYSAEELAVHVVEFP